MSQPAVDTPAAMMLGIGTLLMGIAMFAAFIAPLISKKTDIQTSAAPVQPTHSEKKIRWWWEWGRKEKDGEWMPVDFMKI